MIKSKIKEITIKGRKVKYCLTRKNVKNINMRIKDDMMVHISTNQFIAEHTKIQKSGIGI